MLLVLPPDADTYEQESRQMFMEWKDRFKKTYKYAGEEECRYAVFKESRCRVAWARADGVTTSSLNGLAARSNEEIQHGHRVRKGEGSYEQETRWMFVGWKAKYGKTYRDVGEEECRYRLFKGNRRIVVRLNAAAAARQNAYNINQFGDLTNEEVRESCYPEMVDQELSARFAGALLRKRSLEVAPFLEMKHTCDSEHHLCVLLENFRIKMLLMKHRCARTYGRDLNIRVDIFENLAESCDWNSWKDPIIW
uniref:Cathepsin propeptide inhibitor domain-containing protein n=1 Tax=Setaria viridis TaxID=4556 RepID=A0A4U6W315_SETVI|nr:hypothetical protein SEVIR_1G008600v2 [Setaria viridis]